MPMLLPKPTRIEAAGNKPKLIDEYIGRVNSGHEQVSLAHMHSPGGWAEPGQTPEFDEFTGVRRATVFISAGQQGMQMALSPEDLLRLTKATTADLAVR